MHSFLLLLTLWWPVCGQAQTETPSTATTSVAPVPLVTQYVNFNGNGTDLQIDPGSMQVNADPIETSLSQLAIEIFSLFIPQTLRPGLAVAIQSAAASAQVTGDINSIVTSALFAETPPAFLTAVPSQYQPNIARVEAALSSIRSGINRVSVSSVDYKNSVSIKSLNGSLQTVNSSILISTTDSRGSGIVTLLPATVVNGTKVEVTPTIRSTSTENTVSATPPASSSTNGGYAIPSQVPFAAAGIIGVVGLIAAL
ncbi:hypothetical protein MMC22_002669 [Lobaria immixta]|nr:hypothetical protein [Lobaria immixta]